MEDLPAAIHSTTSPNPVTVERPPMHMGYAKVERPTWADTGKTAIDCLVTFTALGVHPFTASPTDSSEHGREIFAKAVSGEYGTIAEYVAPA